MEEKSDDVFKVTLESLNTNKIKEISFEEEESYQEKPTLSQRLTELAQRVDFRNKVESDGLGPPSKKGTQRWPWEVANSKLRQALTEISVLSDVIQIAQHQKKYVAMDPVVAPPSGGASPAYQYILKKKALGLAAGILQKGAISLSPSSSEKEKEFHKALSSLRQRWRLKRVGSGAIVGDLSYHSSGSTYAGSVPFDVSKSKHKDSEAAASKLSTDSANSVISVTIPRELRGTSEILVFFSPKPVQEIPPLSAFPPPLTIGQLSQRYGAILSAEDQLLAAQNVLFNKELFSQLTKEAYNQKPLLQHEVFTDKIHVPLSMDCWLSILYVREYIPSSSSTGSSFPPPRWDLIVALKQLLRESHKHRTSLVMPHPSTAGFQEQPELRNAGVVPLKNKQIRELGIRKNIFNQFIDKARHVHNEERLQEWLDELCFSSVDPFLQVVWSPDPSLTLTTAQLILNDTLASTDSPRCSVKLVLKVDQVTVGRAEECGGDLTFPLQRVKLLEILKHQVVFQHMKLASTLAEAEKWQVVKKLSRPVLSSAFANMQDKYSETCNMQLTSSDGHRKLDLLFNWNDIITSLSSRVAPREVGGVSVDGWETVRLSVSELDGVTFREKYMQMLNLQF